jgi:hypothetical protein
MFEIVFLHIIMDVWCVVISSDIIVGGTTQEPNLLAKALATSFFYTAYMFHEMQTTFTLTLNISSRPSYFHLTLPMWLCERVKYDI